MKRLQLRVLYRQFLFRMFDLEVLSAQAQGDAKKLLGLYADYGAQQLYDYVGRHGVAKPEDATFLYSDLGIGLLGQALAVRARSSYPDLLAA